MAKKNAYAKPNVMNLAAERITSAPPENALMVCVTGQRSCERLIERGEKLRCAGQPFYVVHCVQTGRIFLNFKSDPDAIEFLFTCASLFNAELAILREDNVIEALVEFAKAHYVSTIVLGASPKQDASSFSDMLSSHLNDVDFVIVE